MVRRFPVLLASVALPALILASPGAAHAGVKPANTSAAGQAAPSCPKGAPLERADFPKRPLINNRYYPLIPGTQFVLEGQADRGGGALPHQVIFTVTDLTKVINGVNTVVMWDRDINEGVLAEAELAFHAQDDDGNVWNLGEYPEEYEEGKFIGAPSTWITGTAGSRAGMLVPGKPRVGAVFPQGYAPSVDFWDCGQVLSKNQKIRYGGKYYHNGLLIDEWAPLEPDSGHQRKFYLPGVGNVEIGAVNDPEGETLILKKVRKLGPRELAQARAAALKLEQRAYKISSVYRRTAPAR
jgi:hypothetical protein